MPHRRSCAIPTSGWWRLAQAGVGVTIVAHFDEALRRTPYDVFVASIQARTSLRRVPHMTPDAAFGHERRGTPATLAALGARTGFRVIVVPPFEIEGRQVRSAEIRNAIASGTGQSGCQKGWITI